MTDKLLHVGCIVRQAGLYELLQALEAHKVGNVEVRPVVRTVLGPEEEPVKKPKQKSAKQAAKRMRSGSVRDQVAAALKPKQQRRIGEIAREIGAKKQSVYSAISAMVEKRLVKHTGVGLYARVKPDPKANGVAAE